MSPVVALFDLDGVFIQPGGYRAASIATLSYFLDQLNLGYLVPDEDVFSLLESVGITSEWDMVPICLAIALNTVSRHLDIQPLDSVPINWNWMRNHLFNNPFANLRVDYQGSIRGLRDLLSDGEAPVNAIMRGCLDGRGREVFPYMIGTPLLLELFSHTRLIDQSLTTPVFQNYVLGSDVFTHLYNLTPFVHVESYLRHFDHSLLDKTTARQVERAVDEDRLRAVVYTARPSLPPRELTISLSGYSPEAEMALELVGLREIPLMGFGRVQFLAEETGQNVEALLKPSPVQALAAIAAAWSGLELQALRWADGLQRAFGSGEFHKFNDEVNRIKLPGEIEVHVFEDSIGGMRAARTASNMLDKLGVNVNLYLWGIALNEEKRSVLQGQSDEVFNNINEALVKVLEK